MTGLPDAYSQVVATDFARYPKKKSKCLLAHISCGHNVSILLQLQLIIHLATSYS